MTVTSRRNLTVVDMRNSRYYLIAWITEYNANRPPTQHHKKAGLLVYVLLIPSEAYHLTRIII